MTWIHQKSTPATIAASSTMTSTTHLDDFDGRLPDDFFGYVVAPADDDLVVKLADNYSNYITAVSDDYSN